MTRIISLALLVPPLLFCIVNLWLGNKIIVWSQSESYVLQWRQVLNCLACHQCFCGCFKILHYPARKEPTEIKKGKWFQWYSSKNSGDKRGSMSETPRQMKSESSKSPTLLHCSILETRQFYSFQHQLWLLLYWSMLYRERLEWSQSGVQVIFELNKTICLT